MNKFYSKEFFTTLYNKSRKLPKGDSRRIELTITAPDVEIHGDAIHLERLFLNIISNAIKFTPSRGSIKIDVSADGKNLVTRISDTGFGISPEDMRKIFNQFYQRYPAEYSGFHGNGLGLSIALAVAKAHGGDIEVESTPGRGSVFTVHLPIILLQNEPARMTNP